MAFAPGVSDLRYELLGQAVLDDKVPVLVIQVFSVTVDRLRRE